MMKKLKWVLVGIIIAVALVAAGFTVWAYTPLGPMPEALSALQPDGEVSVEIGPWITFRPTNTQPTSGLILYPGGRVDPRSYAAAAREIASQGYLVAIVPMPFNLAVFGVQRAGDVIAAHPEIQHWAIGGHSLGGAMAANYAYSHPDAIEGLALWAAYPAANNNLADRKLHVVSVSGTQDGLATADKIEASHLLLPPDTQWVSIEGGNHAQFGWYGLQSGDGTATITREEQLAQVVEATTRMLAALAGAEP